MARVNIEGVGTVTVDDSFRTLSPDQQNAAIQEITETMKATGQGPSQSFASRLGNISLSGIAQGVYEGVKSGLTYPGDVLTGRAQPNDVARSMDVATLGTPVNPGVRAGERAIPGVALREGKPQVPTATELRDAGSEGFNAARNPGVDVRASAVQDWAQRVQSNLENDGIFASDAPKTFAHLQRLQSAPEGSIATFSNLDAARRAFGRAAQSPDKTERGAASTAIRGLDDFVGSVPEADVLAGSPAAAREAARTARGNYAAAMRSNRLTGELDNAYTGVAERGELNAAVANSGQNVGNSIRQRAASVLKDRKQLQGYSPEEVAQLDRIARGGAAENATRFTGNLLGGGGGLGMALTAGLGGAGGAMATGSPLGALLAGAPIVGLGLKKISNELTARQLGKLDEMVRKRSPLYEERAANPPIVGVDPKRANLIRLLLEGANSQ